MKTYVDLVNETVAYYSEDISRRAASDGFCRYITEDGRMCAVGRCLKDPSSIEKHMAGQSVRDILSERPIGQVFRDEYKHLDDVRVWQALQHLHDIDAYWNDSGLTRGGKFARDRALRVAKELDKEVS